MDTGNAKGAEPARPLTSLERRVVGAMLIDGCPGVPELRAQLSVARVTGAWAGGRSPSIDLEMPAGVPAAPLPDAVLPVDAHVYSEDGDYLGELIVWLSNGRLSAVEYAWVTDSMPLSLPEAELLRVSMRANRP